MKHSLTCIADVRVLSGNMLFMLVSSYVRIMLKYHLAKKHVINMLSINIKLVILAFSQNTLTSC